MPQPRTSVPDDGELQLVRLIEEYRDGYDPQSRATHQARAALADALQDLAEEVAVEVARLGRGGAEAIEQFRLRALDLLVMPRPESGPRILAYRVGGRGALRTFLKSVLSNCWIDQMRAQRPGTLLEGDPIDHRSPAVVAEDGLSPWLRDFLVGLSICDRVELLAITAISEELPEFLWEEWLVAYEGDRKVGLPRPFPPDEIVRAKGPRQRIGPLARLLGYRANTFSRRLIRLYERLRPRLDGSDAQ